MTAEQVAASICQHTTRWRQQRLDWIHQLEALRYRALAEQRGRLAGHLLVLHDRVQAASVAELRAMAPEVGTWLATAEGRLRPVC